MIRGRNRGRGADFGAATHQDAATDGLLQVPSGRWLFTGSDGLVTAYASGPEGLIRWTETPSGAFTGPESIEVPRWVGPLTLSRSGEGYVHFAGLRWPVGGGPAHVVVSAQFQSGRGLMDWYDLGVPAAPGVEGEDTVVFGPVVVVNPVTGGVHVLVSLRAGGIVRRVRSGEGRWGRWKSVTTDPYTGEFAAAMPAGGSLEVLAVGRAGVDRWVGASGGRFELRDRFTTPIADGTQTAVETGPKRTTYFWRYPGDDSLVAWRAQSRTSQGGLMALGGAGGGGRPGAARTTIGGYDCTVLAQRGGHGGVEVSAYVTENEGYGAWWASLGETGPGSSAPQVAVDGAGRIVVAVLDKAGDLLVARQDLTQDGLAFGGWTRHGGADAGSVGPWQR
ncbi:hypothetical protein [Streptomyces purpureus]|uniref:hypothetical protein n=1 Tax=Streptomyces purpureus TaxID=1951 RepID=UPI001319FB1A|nr:hypothetical protein [Streptomyces purpureus]